MSQVSIKIRSPGYNNHSEILFNSSDMIDEESVRQRILRNLKILSSFRRRRLGIQEFEVTDTVVDNVLHFVMKGSCSFCGRTDSVCIRSDQSTCQIDEIMDS